MKKFLYSKLIGIIIIFSPYFILKILIDNNILNKEHKHIYGLIVFISSLIIIELLERKKVKTIKK